MFNQLSFNIFGEDQRKDRLFKTREWYLHKAFKWYASLARARGLSALEEDLLYQYEHFQDQRRSFPILQDIDTTPHGSEPRASMTSIVIWPAPQASHTRGRETPSQGPVDRATYLRGQRRNHTLETVPENYAVAARKLFEQVESSCPISSGVRRSQGDSFRGQSSFAFQRAARRSRQAALIPAEWSIVFCDSYSVKS